MLKNTGIKLLHAKNGKEAVDLYQENIDTDVILMDIKMPVMDGIEASRNIRNINQNIPIIALSAFIMPNKKKRCIDAGCDEFISKPVNRKDLISTVDYQLCKNF